MYDRICFPMAKEKTPTRTFTIPNSDSNLISKIQSRCRKHDITLNDSEVVRAGIAALLSLPNDKFLQAVKGIVKLKRGRQKVEDD